MTTTTTDTAAMLRGSVQGVARTLEALAEYVGNERDDVAADAANGAENARWIHDDGELFDDEGTVMSVLEWVLDCLDITVHGTRGPGGDWDTTGVTVLVSAGGPNIWIDTSRTGVHGAWGSDRAWAPLSGEVVELIDELCNW
jgi:hypothetical protein